MCGILAIFNSDQTDGALRKTLTEAARRLRHRGPDSSGYKVYGNNAIAHERLAIVDPDSGAQPFINQDGNVIVAVNGEIYNFKELYETEIPAGSYTPRTHSDCEVIMALYLKHGKSFLNLLRGMFSFVIFDRRDNTFLAARDHMGITPLYVGYGKDGSMWFASEMKAIVKNCARVMTFPPGKLYHSTVGEFEQWYNPVWFDMSYLPEPRADLLKLREAFERSVERRMMSDVPWGVLLSGGLDSSLVASIATRINNRQPGAERLHSFTIGLEGSPDLKAAQGVADFLGTIHHNYVFTIQEGLDALRHVIYHLETYDVTTIRASTPMFLMSRKIKARAIKMVLSGEGADEIFGGYLYFHKAPNAREFHQETVDKLRFLHLYDCLRANKATSAWGLEVRVPFLDRDFLDVAMTLNPLDKMINKAEGRMEKYIIRKAFDVDESSGEEAYLPRHILWRQKEQFSDGVGYGWIDALRDYAATEVTDLMFHNAERRFPVNPPKTKEAFLYRMIFEDLFPQPSACLTVPGGPSIACSTPRAIEWDESFKNRADPSGRAVAAVHDQAYADHDLAKHDLPAASASAGAGAPRSAAGLSVSTSAEVSTDNCAADPATDSDEERRDGHSHGTGKGALVTPSNAGTKAKDAITPPALSARSP